MDDKRSKLPNILDGNLLPAGQIGKGQAEDMHDKMYEELVRYLRHHRYEGTFAPYCEDNELLVLWEHEHLPWRENPVNQREMDTRKTFHDIMDRVPLDIIAKVQEQRLKNQKPKKTRYELGAREFTLTYSPKWMDDAAARNEMTRAINKLLKYYSEDIIQLRAVGEVGANGLSHVHCFFKLKEGVKITDKNFKRAWKYWNPKKKIGRGFEGGHHATIKEESDFLGYIDKDADTAWLDINACPQRE